MSKTSRDFETQNQVTDAMMEKWGYTRRQMFSSRKKNISVSGFDVYQPPTLPKLKDTQGEGQQGFRYFYGEHKNYLRMAQKIFNEFNDVVEGRKRKVKKEIIQLRPVEVKKSSLEMIEDSIEQTKNEISRTQIDDLKKQFKANNKLNGLFREFHTKASEEKEREYSYKDIPLNTYDSGKFRKELNFKPSRVNYVFVKEKKKPESFLEPFEKEFQNSYLESERVEVKISQEKEVIDLYKSRVDEIKCNYIKYKESLQDGTVVEKPVEVPSETLENYEMYDMRITEPDQQINCDKISANHLRKQQLFTKILKNKNLKYVKEIGTNSLVKYDQRKQAKQLLNGKMGPKLGRLSKTVDQHLLKKLSSRTQDYYDLQTMAGPPRRIPLNKDYNAQYRSQKLHVSMRLRNRTPF